MRKLVAVLCAVVLMLTMAVPAFANGSITEIATQEVEVTADTVLPIGAAIVVEAADPTLYADEGTKTVVSAVNDPDGALTVEEAVKTLDPTAGTTAVTESGNTVDLSEYDFATGFSDLALKEGSDVSFTDVGTVKATLAIDALVGETDLSNYLIMLIDPATGEVVFIELDPENFDSETGVITAEFPFLGTFALIQK